MAVATAALARWRVAAERTRAVPPQPERTPAAAPQPERTPAAAPQPERAPVPPPGWRPGGLRTRLLTALLAAPPVLLLLAEPWAPALARLGPPWAGFAWGTWALAVLLAGLAAVEWSRLVVPADARRGWHSLGLLSTLAVPLALPLIPGSGLILALPMAVVPALALLLTGVVGGLGPRALNLAQGVAVIAGAAVALVLLRLIGLDEVAFLLAVVWATDTAAYFGGRALGGPRLAPRISPNKTWSGLASGVVAAALAAALWALATARLNLGMAALLGAGLALVAQLGDLWMSTAKRRAGVKDTGHLLPGHGGVLDRIDGMLPVAPLVLVLFLIVPAPTGHGP